MFNCKWLGDANNSWVREFEGGKHKAICCVCNKLVALKCMDNIIDQTERVTDENCR